MITIQNIIKTRSKTKIIKNLYIQGFFPTKNYASLPILAFVTISTHQTPPYLADGYLFVLMIPQNQKILMRQRDKNSPRVI